MSQPHLGMGGPVGRGAVTPKEGVGIGAYCIGKGLASQRVEKQVGSISIDLDNTQVAGAIPTSDATRIPVYRLSMWGGGQHLLGQLEAEVPEYVAYGILSSLIDCGAWLPQSAQRLGLRP